MHPAGQDDSLYEQSVLTEQNGPSVFDEQYDPPASDEHDDYEYDDEATSLEFDFDDDASLDMTMDEPHDNAVFESDYHTYTQLDRISEEPSQQSQCSSKENVNDREPQCSITEHNSLGQPHSSAVQGLSLHAPQPLVIEEPQLDDPKLCKGTADYAAIPFLVTESSTFSITKKGPRLVDSFRIRNLPPFVIGFLDLANSGDFAANVFNQIPVPVYATVLMVIGATCALLMSYVAFSDARRSFRNIRLLRRERTMLLAQGQEGSASIHSYAVELDLNHRDLWTEIFDRGGMEVMMGFAAFLIAVGTYMAPAGANPRIYEASNLLSGYIGNAPAAAYGLITFAWSIYVFVRAHRQFQAAKSGLPEGSVLVDLTSRIKTIQEHAILTGVICLLSGVLSMFTPTYWWPYPVLLVCGLTFLYGTHVYRAQIGYERPQILAGLRIDKATVLAELANVSSSGVVLQQVIDSLSEKSAIDANSLSFLLSLILKCDLFEHFSKRLVKDQTISEQIVKGTVNEIHLGPTEVESLPEQFHPRLREIAQTCLRERGTRQLSYRKRFLLEALGCSLAAPLYSKQPPVKER